MADTKIRISAETAQATAALKSFSSSLTGIRGNLSTFAGAIGGALSVGAFAGFIKSSIDLQDELGSLSKKTSIAASDLAGLKFAADQNGASLEMVAKGVKELAINMASTPDKFAKLGINATTATEALIQMSDLVSSMPDGFQKTRVMAELMGKKVGPEMAEFLNMGGAAMREYIAKGKDIYKVTDESAAKAKEYKDSMAELEARMSGVGVAIASRLLPGLTEAARGMSEAAEKGDLLRVVWEALAGMAKVPYDLLMPPENLRESLSSANRLKELQSELAALESNLQASAWHGKGGGVIQRWLHGTPEEQQQRAVALRNQIETIKKHAAELDAIGTGASGKPKTTPAAVTDLLAGNNKDGTQILIGLERSYQAELAKRKEAMAAPLLSASQKQLAEDMRNVTKQAQDARIELEKLHASKNGISDSDYAKRLEEITAKEQAQTAAVKELQTQQDKLNASWEYGAAVAMRKYLDDVGTTAKQTEKLVSGTFSAMEDSIAKFYRSGSADLESFKNAVLDIMAQIAAQKTMTGLMSLFGGTSSGYGDTAGVAAGVPSYDGGGFTGSGSRAGGLDGKGGFMAMLHPNETVVDHTRGGSMGGGVNVTYAPTIYIDSRTDRDEVEKLVSSAVQQGNAQLVDNLQRQRVI